MTSTLHTRVSRLEQAAANSSENFIASVGARTVRFDVELLNGAKIAVEGGSPECAEWITSSSINGVLCRPYDGPESPVW